MGSFAVGDADAHSDVDFVVVTNDDVTGEECEGLQTLHERIYALETPLGFVVTAGRGGTG